MSKAARLKAAHEAEAEAVRQRAAFASADFSKKLDRALTHIEALDTSFQRWLDGDAYVITLEQEAQSGDHVAWAEVSQDPLDDWPLIVGDAIHNLRSALDQLLYAIALKHAESQGVPLKPSEGRAVMFPVVAVGRGEKTPADVYNAALWRLRCLPEAALTEVQALQPYERPGNPEFDPLWVLNELDIIDKHRRLHVTAWAAKLIHFQMGNGHIKHLSSDVEVTKGKTELLRYRPFGAQNMNMGPAFTREITLREGPPGVKGVPLVALLLRLRLYIIDSVATNFVQFF